MKKKNEKIFLTIEEGILKEDAGIIITHLASEKVLAKDWLIPEEDEAWKDL